MGVATAVYCQFRAAHAAKEMAQWKGPSHHGDHGKPGKHHHPEQRPEEHEDSPMYVSRTEFEIYDSIKAWSCLAFFMFAKLIALGKCGKKATWKNKSNATHRIQRKSCVGLLLIVIVAIFLGKEENHIGKIMERVAKHNNPKQFDLEDKQYGWPPKHDGRHLAANGTMLFVGDDEEVCNKNTDEASCNTSPGASCSWCTSAAVKAACHSVKNAKTLPPAVFSCSNVGEVEEPIEVEEFVKDSVEDMCKVRSDESTCVSDFQCGWCNDGCHSIENAQDDGCELPLPPMP